MNLVVQRSVFGIALVAAALVSSTLREQVASNQNAIDVVVTAFSILAGFIAVIITVAATPSVIAGKSWRYYELRRELVANRLNRYKTLFLGYLLTILLIFVARLLPSTLDSVRVAIEHLYLLLGTFCLVVSFLLPGWLLKLQLEQHDELVNHFREKVGLDRQGSNSA
ncbi:MAG: hypothetical protein AAGM16_03205 [Pseudomonadota bacterium]